MAPLHAVPRRCARSRLVALATFAAIGGLAACTSDDGAFPLEPQLTASHEATAASIAAVAQRPFMGSTRGQMVGLGSDPRCPASHPTLMLYRGVGHITHLGLTTIEGSECANLTDPTANTTRYAEWKLTAANGDWIRFAYDPAYVTGAEPPVIYWAAYPVFRSGSGRFENATLDVTWSGGLDLQTFATWSTFEGTIRY
jgi:hypothetical protein